MTKQDDVRAWAFVFLRPRCVNDEHAEAYVSDFLRGMSERGVVLKVERELPDTIPVLPKFYKQGIITEKDLLDYARLTEVMNRMEYIKSGVCYTEPLIGTNP